MNFLETEIAGVPLQNLLIALGTAIVVTVVLRGLFAFALARLTRFAGRTETDVDNLFVGLLEKTRVLFIGLVVLWVAARPLDLSPGADVILRGLLVIGLHLQIGFWGVGMIDYLVGRWRRRHLDDDPGVATAVGVVGFVARIILWSLLVLAALGTMGVAVSPFIASLGIGGVAVALALQNVLGDLFASLAIVFDKPFVVGDFIAIDDFSGTVEYVGLKTTRIRSISGEQLVFSNSDLLASRVRNYGRMRERRVVFEIGVRYGTPTDVLRAIPGYIRGAIESLDNTRFDRAHLRGFGGTSIDFETVYYMTVPDYNAYMDTQQAINLELHQRFESEGIAFALPTRIVTRVDGTPDEGEAEATADGPEKASGEE